MPPDSEKARRERRAAWSGEVVRLGESTKSALYSELTRNERLAAYAKLNERAWIASGRQMPAPLPRREWPGEVYRLGERG
jgi:hypothetical protein